MTSAEGLKQEIQKTRNRSEYYRAYYQANKAKKKAKALEWQSENQDRTKAAKHKYYLKRKWENIPQAYHSCIVCSSSDKDDLTFHHVNPALKVFQIATYLYKFQNRVDLEVLESELEKTVCLCTSCHTALHSSKDLTFLDEFIKDWEKSHGYYYKVVRE